MTMIVDALTQNQAPEANSAGELWITLGRVFLPPRAPDSWRALHADLPADLADWSRELGLAAAPPVKGLRDTLAAHAEHEAMLVHYSSLFYAPPVQVPLNLGFYLDGTLNGPSLDALERWHAAFDLGKQESFHDLADHLAAVLEFLAMVSIRGEAGQAAAFAHAFLLPALPKLIGRLEAAGAVDSPYHWLARFSEAALVGLYPREEPSAVRCQARYRRRPVGDGWQYCERCGKPIATERELGIMKKALAAAGLAADHLRHCPDCRDAAHGWGHRPLPSLRG